VFDGLLFVPIALVMHGFSRHPRAGFFVLSVVLSAAYEIGFIALTGQTLGKRWTRIRVVNSEGSIPTPSQACMRWVVTTGLPQLIGLVAPALTLLYPLVDDLWAVRDADNQALHDKAAATYVVAAAPRV